MFLSAGKLSQISKGAGPVVAPFSAVALLLHFDEGSGTTTVDSSSVPATATITGGASISSSTSISGPSSLALSTTAAATTCAFASDARFNIGQAKYTIELWVNPTSPTGGGQQCIWVFNGAGGNNDPYLEIVGANMLLRSANTGPDLVTPFAHGMSAGTWHHVAVCKDGTSIKIFVDGVLKGSGATGANIISENKTFALGGGNVTATMTGFVDEVRLTQGYALYSNTFTPPTPPFPNS